MYRSGPGHRHDLGGPLSRSAPQVIDRHPFFRGMPRPAHISHRGGAKLYPENTLLAFEHAVHTYRTDVLELDIRATKDGQVVVFHDETVDRCTDGTGPLAALSWNELQALDAGYLHSTETQLGLPYRGRGIRVPSLAQVLGAFPDVRLNVELKCPEVLDPFLDLVRDEPALHRMCVGSEHDVVAARLADSLPQACLFYPREALTGLVLALKAGVEPTRDDRFTVMDMPYHWEGQTLFDVDLAQQAKRLGKWINVWTVDEPTDMRAAIAGRVDGIMSDRPDLLRRVLDERKRAGRRCHGCRRPVS